MCWGASTKDKEAGAARGGTLAGEGHLNERKSLCAEQWGTQGLSGFKDACRRSIRERGSWSKSMRRKPGERKEPISIGGWNELG